ncbi:unnamed protein product [Triticum turgidum subsp. durum]|uniref:CMP/dCMP-type deaminase domain-containing protein n=1 Tax=Triticum turgidum subsp. durum TaxID=4567 RepID=A0A9R1AED9_TRITD|nr:unnamed protein product [Triticum turgidum subsp. durum]
MWLYLQVFALRDAGHLAENATAYVSLEPCNHYGRTPPCTEALIKAKVKEVVVGMTDPNPIVASKGIEKLRNAGIDVRVGVEEALCLRLNEAYIHRMLTGKAFATLRTTLSMNGTVINQIGSGADQPGGYYSQLAKEYDGVIISSDMAKATTLPISREAGAKQPLYIIIAQGEGSKVHIPFLNEESASNAIVLADSPVAVEPSGVSVSVLDQMNLESILRLLADRGLCSVLVDFRDAGGVLVPLLSKFQEDKLVQKVVVELSPVWVVSPGPSDLAFGGSQSFPLKNVEHKEETIVHSYFSNAIGRGHATTQDFNWENPNLGHTDLKGIDEPFTRRRSRVPWTKCRVTRHPAQMASPALSVL